MADNQALIAHLEKLHREALRMVEEYQKLAAKESERAELFEEILRRLKETPDARS